MSLIKVFKKPADKIVKGAETMKQFEVGDIIKYSVFYKGFTVIQTGMIASGRSKRFCPSDYGVSFGYDVLNEKNKIVWVWEHNIEDKEE